MWIKSYLTKNHKQKVKLGNSFSDAFSLTLPPSAMLFTVSMSHTIYMLMTPNIYLALNNGDFDPSIAELTEFLACV